MPTGCRVSGLGLPAAGKVAPSHHGPSLSARFDDEYGYTVPCIDGRSCFQVPAGTGCTGIYLQQFPSETRAQRRDPSWHRYQVLPLCGSATSWQQARHEPSCWREHGHDGAKCTKTCRHEPIPQAETGADQNRSQDVGVFQQPICASPHAAAINPSGGGSRPARRGPTGARR